MARQGGAEAVPRLGGAEALRRGECGCALRWGDVSVPRGEEEEADVPRRGGAGEVWHDGEEDVALEKR